MDGYTLAWASWLTAFVVIEGSAFLSRRAGASLSEHVWSWFHVRKGWGKPSVAIPRALLLTFLAWLLLHLGFGWLTT